MTTPNALHTPGEWGLIIPRLEPRHAFKLIPENRILVVHPDGERIIADCSVGYCGDKGDIPLAEREANARLLRAAPKMLDTLKKIENEFYIGGALTDPEMVEVCREKLAAAIYEATGREAP